METRTSGVPSAARYELRRERLLEVLHKHRARPLILLVAPAGFGKSTLAATYARDSGGAVAWLTLQPADRDTRRLFTRLADALDKGFGEPGSVPELKRGLDEGAEGVGLARLLLDDLAQAPAGFIVVLDDFQLVNESEEVVNAVDALIRELPEAGQIVITSRDAPQLSMTRLVVDGAVFPLGTDDLRFSTDETRELRRLIRAKQREEAEKAAASGPVAPVAPPAEPDPDEIVRQAEEVARQADEDRRDEQAEGWVAGILLGGAPRQLNIGGGSLLGSYVEREVLSRLSETEQHWLEMLSVFDTITPQAAERMLGPANWSSRLLALTERCPFLVAGQDGTYRLHNLVRETVLNRLRRSPDDRSTQAWTVARQLAEEAADPVMVVRACQELGQIDGAVELVQRTALEQVQAGRWRAVVVTLELLPEHVRRANPALSLIEARALVLTGNPDSAREAAQAALQHGGRSGDVFVQVSAIVELANIAFASDMSVAEDWLSAADHLLRTGVLTTDQRRLLEGRALGVRGICCTLRGETQQAREAFENSQRLLDMLGPSRDLALVQQNFGSFCTRTGDYRTAKRALSASTSHWRLMGDRNGLATTQTILGHLDLRLGELEAAGAEINDALQAARSVGALRMQAYATVELAQWHRANGRIVEAVAAFDEGIRQAEDIVERELLADALVARAEVSLLLDDFKFARQLLARAQEQAQLVGSTTSLAAVDRALGKLSLKDGAAANSVNYFESALLRTGASWGPDDRAQTLYWLGTAKLKLHDGPRAIECLERALAIVQETNLPGLFASAVAEDSTLLNAGRQAEINPALLREIERLSTTRRPWTGVTPNADQLTIAVKNDLPRLEVRLFGSFLLFRDGDLVEQASRKVDRVRELAALLILNPQGMADSDIADAMYPEMGRESGLHNVQMATYQLRKELGKVAIRYAKRTYQLNPNLELIADVHKFDDALARARGSSGAARLEALELAVELYRGPLLADAAWHWIEPVRLDYRNRFVSAALQLADLYAQTDGARSDALAEAVLVISPDSDSAYDRLIQNAQQRRDHNAVRRILKQYEQAAAQYGFTVRRYRAEPGTGRLRASR